MNCNGIFSKKTDEWSTPQDLFDNLNKEFHFDLDPCATDENHKCNYYITKETDGLSISWKDHIVFCNPPYSNVAQWVFKAYFEPATTVMLLPARTDTKWFHNFIYNKEGVEIRFLKGRLKFGNSKNSAPFPSMIVIFRRDLY